MNKARRCLLIAMAAVMIFSSAVTALAIPPTIPSVPLDPNEPVTLTIHHRIEADGTQIDQGNPVTGANPNPSGVPVVGASWTVQRFEPPATWDGNFATFNPAWLVAGTAVTRTTNTNGEAFFDSNDVIQGLWWVTTDYAGVSDNPFAVSLPHYWPAMPENGPWLYNVHVFVKQPTPPGLTKTFLNNRMVPGVAATPDGYAVVEWRLSFDIRTGLATLPQIPEGGGVHIQLVDTLDERLELITAPAANAPVARFQTADSPDAFADLIYGTHWDFTYNETTNVFTVNILTAGRDLIGQANSYGGGLVGGQVQIDFQTRVVLENDRDEDELGVIVNNATMRYSINEVVISNDAETEIFGLEVLKTSANGTTPLGGAVFHLFRAEDVTNGVINAGAVPIGVRTSSSDAATLGQLWFYGLVEGTYYLYEITPPAGYRRITAPMQVVVSYAVYPENSYLVEVTAVNTRNFELPLTGGAGTLLFTALGLSLIGGSILLFVVLSKKKQKTGRRTDR